jgi:retrograde regulation protein 2
LKSFYISPLTPAVALEAKIGEKSKRNMDVAKSEYYRAIVDMGSNGIRFSITDLSPSTARIMPTVYQDRAGISLYDAQWSTNQKEPIPDGVIADVLRALLRFKRTCEDFGVKDGNVRILATEATRQAINSEAYRAKIKDATGWTVEMLSKEDEGRVGAMGVVSSFSTVKGLMMDLGGGSTQITWLIAENGEVRMSDAGSVSMPYGAAALMRRLTEANKLGGKAPGDLKDEITANLKDAVQKIAIPQEILDTKDTVDGLTLYLSGGGFRGWGFVLMSQHPVSPYPVPIINGFKTSISTFTNTSLVKSTAVSEDDIFRVSERRASQVPAVALLVSCMIDALPAINTVRFAQGGVREGSLYMNLDAKIRAQHPLVTATIPYTTPSTIPLLALLDSASPGEQGLPSALITALGQSLYLHNSLNKDLKSAAALRSTTTGSLSGVHGAAHDERAALGVMLCERWGGLGGLPPGEAGFYQRLLQLLGPESAWWCMYYGRVAAVIGEVYPAGVVRPHQEKLHISASWSDKEPSSSELSASESKLTEKAKDKVKKHKKNKDKDKSGDDEKKKAEERVLKIAFNFGADEDSTLLAEGVQKTLRSVEKLGRKKNWPEGWGCKIDLRVKGGSLSALPAESE